MKIELKNIKYAEFASQETHCFEASVYIDGKRAGTVGNDGRGGSHDYHPRELWQTLKAHAETMPGRMWKLDGNELELKPDPDTIIDNLLVEHLYSRDLKRAMSKRIVFLRDDGVLRESVGLKKEDMQKLLSDPALPTKLNANKILNLMPFDAALLTYRAAVAAGV